MTIPDDVVLHAGSAACLACKVAIRSAFGPALKAFVAKHTHTAAPVPA